MNRNHAGNYIQYFIIMVVMFNLALLSANEFTDSFQYISPVPGAKFVSRETGIILRPGRELAVSGDYLNTAATIVGSISGNHGYRAVIAADHKTIILKPDRIFTPGETVTVRLTKNILTVDGYRADSGSFDFVISPLSKPLTIDPVEEYYEELSENNSPTNDVEPINDDLDVSLPSDFPPVTVSAVDNPDSGYIFICSRRYTSPYLMILDNTGYPVYYQRIPNYAVDFKKQENGMLSYNLFGHLHYVMDSTYTLVDSIQCGNGYANNTDVHDFQLLPNNHALLIAYDAQIVDMSEVVSCGQPTAVVIGLIVQELDSDKNVIFQWRSWDHYQITDANANIDLCGAVIDYVHGNSVELDRDDNLIISARHMDEVTKIDRQTGDIIWRLGGKNNEFTFVNDELHFSYQHDARRLANGNLTIYDNGVWHTPQFSRAIEYELDEENKIAALAWAFKKTPDLFAFQNGNVQRLSNGNTMIGWGGPAQPTLTEVHQDSTIAFELTFGTTEECYSYRAFRFTWHGIASIPYLIAEPADDHIHLIFNKFGDTSVTKYYIYGGTDPQPMEIMDSTSSTNFDLYNLISGQEYYFRVTAVDELNNESAFSNEVVAVLTMINDLYLPGDINMKVGDWPPKVIGSDVTYLVGYFRSINLPCFMNGFFCAADINGDCQVIGSDVTRLVNYFRDLNGIRFCPDYVPAWITPDDLPMGKPAGWPMCEDSE
jgi:hypothetical protein